jgi:hypothetical protein
MTKRDARCFRPTIHRPRLENGSSTLRGRGSGGSTAPAARGVMGMSDPVPAIAEAAATGETVEIFDDIRRVLGVEVVNLIWRHLATIPGALPWTWVSLRPGYIDGTIVAEAAALHAELALPPLARFPRELFAALSLTEADLGAIHNILAAYDRTNAMAAVALSALLSRLGESSALVAAASHDEPGDSSESLPAIPLPALPNVAALPKATADLVLLLNRLGTRRQDAVLASMYRHLAYWPAYLALIWGAIAPLDADGSLERSIAQVKAQARTRAERFSSRLPGPPSPKLAVAIRSAVEPFVGDAIVKMIVICALLRKATPAASAATAE